MSKTNLYNLYDNEAGTIVGPIVAERRHAPAVRMFNELLSDPKTLPGQYPEHFNLIWIGEQETDTAELTPVKPTIVATGKDWLAQKARKDVLALDAQLEVQAP